MSASSSNESISIAGGASPKPRWTNSRSLVIGAVGYQWFYNGANFIAFKVGGEAIPPPTLAAMRFVIAAALVLPLALWRWRCRPARPSQLLAAAALGVVMLVGGQALGMLGTHLLPAGVASVFGSAAPILLALFAWAVLREPLSGRQLCGVALGFVGLALMAWTSLEHGGLSLAGVALALGASASWAAGSLWSRRLRLPDDPVIVLATQLIASAAVLAAVTAMVGDACRTELAAVPASAWWSLAYLVVASTLVGYAVFIAVNADVSSTVANSFAYAAPVVALILSAALLGEPLSVLKVFAAGVTLSGVALMLRRPVVLSIAPASQRVRLVKGLQHRLN